ncbi:MAG: IS481 family transposase, partial [Actinobacteria bacterium]|nr:IS481 family transposase [Actinomycetota bacterium]
MLAVVSAGRSQAEVAREYDVSRGWVSKLIARYRDEGEAAFRPRSRRPKSSPNRISDSDRDRICQLRRDLTSQGHDAGADTMQWFLAKERVEVSTSTIWRVLREAGLVKRSPKKKPRSAYKRFAAELPNEMWQSDFTHIRLADGHDTETISWLDDHSRYALDITAFVRITVNDVDTTFLTSIEENGPPAATLTDNGMVYTTRFSGGTGGRNQFEHTLDWLHIQQRNGAPGHPTTTGKVERFQQTLKKWLSRQDPQPRTLAELQALLDQFRHYYNHERPHRGINRRTPAAAYASRPKATPQRRARPPLASPLRPHRPHRKGHPAPQQHPLQDRHRTNPQQKARHHARQRPRHHHRRTHHRRNPTVPDPRPHPQIPATKQKLLNPN